MKDADSDAVVCEISIDAPASVVYELFTNPSLLARWIGIEARLERVPGGLFRFELVPGEFCSGRYLERLAAVAEGRDPGLDPAAAYAESGPPPTPPGREDT